MKHLSFILILAVCLIFNGCSKDEEDPVACFNFTTNSGQINFNSGCSERAKSFLWEFGDGGTSIAASPIHTYYVDGYYQVTLKVTSSEGVSHSNTQSVGIAL